ncbi:MAG: hypothetical protein WAV21_00520 [Minisyncoccia bacterium]
MTIDSLLIRILELINNVAIPLIFAGAFLLIVFGVFRYFIAGGADEEKRKEGRTFILYGIIGLAVMFSVWGLVNVLVNTFGFDSIGRPALPLF